MILESFLIEQINFSTKTFGPEARPAGILNHIQKELTEIAANPNDIEEWIDVVILAFDGAWRQGFTVDEIAKALQAKLDKNKSRKWPDWRKFTNGQAIEHIRVVKWPV